MKYLTEKIDQAVDRSELYWRFFESRHPAKEGMYIVHCPTEDPNKPLIHIAWWSKKNQCFELIPSVWSKAVSHWMPLPPPPRIEVVL